MMKQFLVLFGLLSAVCFSQTKADFIADMDLDSVYFFRGHADQDFQNNCFLLKYTGNANTLKDSIILNHQYESSEVEVSEKGVVMRNVIKPYWVYGTYEVHVEINQGAAFAVIEIYHKAYDMEGNYEMPTAQQFYQELVNNILN